MKNFFRRKKQTQKQEKAESSSYSNSRSFKIINIILGLLVAGLVIFLANSDILHRLELFSIDLRYVLRGQTKTSDDIVLINIDEDSIKNIGRWPWSREWHASLITTLNESAAKIIGFDIFFSEPSPLIDFFLIEATKLAKNVSYALAFEIIESSHKGKNRDEIPEKTLSRFAIYGSQIKGDKSKIPSGRPIDLLPQLYDAASGAGHVVVIPDQDGSIRSAPSVIEYNGHYFVHFAIELALSYYGLDKNDIRIELGEYMDLGLTSKGPIRIPINKDGSFMINWSSKWKQGFTHYPFWKVISSYQRLLKGEKPLIDLNCFKDKICLIGLTALGLIDIKPMPLQKSYPSVGMHANILNSIIQNNFIKKAKSYNTLVIIMLLSLIVSFTIPRFRPVGGALFSILLIAIYAFISFILFKFLGVLINVVYPFTAIALNAIIITVHTEVANAIERARLYHLAVEDGLTKLYVVRHFKEELAKEISKAHRYDRPLSVIISDIDHFKNVNDTYGHLAGDFILREAANLFKSTCRESDIAGRYGGEEFVILLPETDREGGVEFAERLRKLIEGLTLEYNEIKFNITISFGVAELKDETNPADLIKRADEALYVAKETGRNKVCFG